MNNKELFCLMLGLIFLISLLSFYIGININKKNITPYNQTYKYLFNKVESSENGIIKTEYYGKTYITIPLLHKECSVQDYLSINQSCEKSHKFILLGDTEQ